MQNCLFRNWMQFWRCWEDSVVYCSKSYLLAKTFLRKPADIKWFIFFNSNEWPAGTDTIFYVRTFSRLVIEIRGVNQSYLSQVCCMCGPTYTTQSFFSTSISPNVSTTPLWQWGFWQRLPFIWTTLRGKHCWHPIAVMGVVDTFGLSAKTREIAQFEFQSPLFYIFSSEKTYYSVQKPIQMIFLKHQQCLLHL